MPLRSKLLSFVCLFASLSCLTLLAAQGETFRNPRRIPLTVDPASLTTGDLNGDGRNDIVWTDLANGAGTASLHVLLAGANGQYASTSDVTRRGPLVALTAFFKSSSRAERSSAQPKDLLSCRIPTAQVDD